MIHVESDQVITVSIKNQVHIARIIVNEGVRHAGTLEEEPYVDGKPQALGSIVFQQHWPKNTQITDKY